MEIKIGVEYLKELLDNSDIKIKDNCTICKNTLKDLKKQVNKEYKKRFD